jgi:magnesium-transporting ATPase (P-type)
MNSTNILWIIVAVAVICLLSWLFYSAKGDAVRLLSMIVLAIILVISLFYLSFAAFYLVTDWNGDISKEIRSVGTFTLGLPVAALGSLALAEGRWGNAKFALTPIQQKEALRMIAESRSQAEVAKVFRVHRSTLWRLLSERRVLERAA